MTHPLKKAANYLPNNILLLAKETPLENLYYKIVSKPKHWKTVTVKTDTGHFELTIPDDATLLGGESYSEGLHEPQLIQTLNNTIQNNMIFYDIGARYGYFIGVASSMGVSPSNIHAFEQHHRSFEILDFQWGDKVDHLNKCSVGNETNQVKIDDYIKNHTPPDVMKIDVEGAEISVLLSSRDTLELHAPTLLIEIHPKRLAKNDKSISNIVDILDYYNYDITWTNHRVNNANIGWFDIENKNPPTNRTYLIKATR